MSDVEAMRLVTVNEVAGIAGVRPAHIYAEIASGALPCYRIGSTGWCVRVALSDVEAWLEARRSTADRPIRPTVGPTPRSAPVRKQA